MPFFFQYSKNGRARTDKPKYKQINKSTMNRICSEFMKPFKTNLDFRHIPKFNYKMLSSGMSYEFTQEGVDEYIKLAKEAPRNIDKRLTETEAGTEREIYADEILNKLKSKYDLYSLYESIVESVFSNDSHPQCIHHTNLFFDLFGDIYIRNLQKNLEHSHTCGYCGRLIPSWQTKHQCESMAVCPDCGSFYQRKTKLQLRCKECQSKMRSQRLRDLEASKLSDQSENC